jgi:hypothetical protein
VDLKNLDKGISFHKKFDEIEVIYDDHMMIKVGDRYPLELSYDAMTHEAIVSMSETNIHITNKKEQDNGTENKTEKPQEERNLNDTLDVLFQNKSDLSISIFETNSKLKVNTDSKYVLPQFTKFYESPSSYRKLKLSEDDIKKSSLDVQFKIGEPLALSPTEYLNLLGKRVVLNLPDNKQNTESVSGLVIWKKEVSSVKEAQVSQTLPLPKNPNESNDSGENNGESSDSSLQIPLSGASCSTSNPSALVDAAQYKNQFEIFLKRGANNMVDVSLMSDIEKATDLTLFFDRCEEGSVALTLSPESESGKALYTGQMSMKKSTILGKKVQVRASNQIVFECYLEKSRGVQGESTDVIIQELVDGHNNKDESKQTESYEEKQLKTFSYTRIYIILGLFLAVGVILCLCSFCGKKIREAGQVEMREVYPEENFNGEQWRN